MEFKKYDYDFKDKYLWKYFTIHKFIHLVNNKKLFFTRLDNFDDPNEGLPEKLLRELYAAENLFPDEQNLNPNIFKTPVDRKRAFEGNKNNLKNLLNKGKKLQKRQFANCWFVGDRESYAMWNLYSNSESVAIKIKPSDLLDKIEKSVNIYSENQDVFQIFSGPVHYNKVYPPEFEWTKYQPVKNKLGGFKKDESYSFENEYRFLALAEENNDISFFELKVDNLFDCEFNIVTHPKMTGWMYQNIEDILKNIGKEKLVRKSDIKLASS